MHIELDIGDNIFAPVYPLRLALIVGSGEGLIIFIMEIQAFPFLRRKAMR
ncbi:hypothetical protein SBF1_5230005 [Candidatus Desulfosporosinus infrequens]|uniref:Uncharacterized protein n=1 Tax=Candidatus Desulfosporosinus infrequens TaxID=2043169 RepID=A0A2U3LII3_9FIRM|nr:hypothetical protein SBF1_5230005 [Candidatus Desulfosporosinus infrequens]